MAPNARPPTRRFQYQVASDPTFAANVPPPPVITAIIAAPLLSVGIIVATTFQYQALAEPVAPVEVIRVDKWHKPFNEPVRAKPGLTAAAQSTTVLQLNPNTQITQGFESRWHSPWSEPVRVRQLSVAAQPTGVAAPFVAEVVTVDKWYPPWRDPVRAKPGLQTGLQQAFTAPAFVPQAPGPATDLTVPIYPVAVTTTQQTQYQSYASPLRPLETVTLDKWVSPWSEPARTRQLAAAQQQAVAAPLFISETITVDKWFAPWREPVRAKPGLSTSLQQFYTSGIEDTLEPGATYESPWHYPWSEPVRQKPGLLAALQPDRTVSPIQPIENITPDKWFAPWREPVREKPGLRTSLQPFFAFVLDPSTEITQGYESRWHYPWSEPVRVRQLATAQQQSVAQGEPSFEVITADKWVYPWSEPVRQKPGLLAALQHFTAQTVLDPDTQITQNYESKWHYAWSEPVRVKPALQAGLQQPVAAPVFVPETVTLDKWFALWREPVREKPGLRTNLQPFFAFVLDPSTEITQSYESRWHYPWSEPVRTRQLATAQQQSVAQGEPSFEVITVDKWTYPWSEPVRQKPGLGTQLQQFYASPVFPPRDAAREDQWHQPWSEPARTRQFAPAYQQGFFTSVRQPEPRVDSWVYPWSDPVRVRQLAVAQQQAYVAPVSTPEFITVDKWYAPWREPVREKPGLRASLHPFFAFVLDPSTEITQGYESRWHYPWSEPVRIRALATAQQQAAIAPATSVFEIVTLDKWYWPLEQPVRVALRAPWYQPFTIDTAAIPIQRMETWYQPLSEPSVKYQLRTPWYQPFTIDTAVIPTKRLPTWFYPWSDPVRQKPGLTAALQQAAILQTPPFPTFIKTINWYAPLNEPVRLKQGLGARYQQAFTIDQHPLISQILLTLSATEVNTDSALFSMSVYNQVAPPTPSAPSPIVSIKEIPTVSGAASSITEPEATSIAGFQVSGFQKGGFQ